MDFALNTFISIDIETTGLDSEIDRITEIGAVKYENGIQTGSFSQLVNPGISIPPDIIELTGIDNEMVKSAPSIEEAITGFEDFLGDSPLIIGQNVIFDISFLKRYISPKYVETFDNHYIDTSIMARLVWPGLRKYSLSSLTEFVGIKNRDAHRALADAEATASVYLHELSAIRGFPQKINSFIAGLLFGELYRKTVLSSIENISENLPSSPAYDYDYGDNIIGSDSIEPSDDYIDVDIDPINEIFDNRFREVLDDYEERPQQLEMASQVAGAFNRSEIYLAEAPTGIGKSLAYLVPALMWSQANGESVIVSTQTKNLQDQLFNKDIPLVKQAVEFNFKAVLLKGRGNYLCLLKYYELLNEAIRAFNIEQRHILLPLVVWAETTKTGDISECSGFNPGRNRYFWSRISCEGSFCPGKTCSYFKKCFLLRIKNESLTAHIKVINHHLLFADFASGGELVRSSGHAILDEAHNLEKVAASYLGPLVNHSQFITFFNQIFTIRPIETGFLALVKFNASGLNDNDNKRINKEINKVQRVLLSARSDISNFFEKLAASLLRMYDSPNGPKEIRYFKLTKFIDEEVIETCLNTLKELEFHLKNFIDEIEISDSLKDKNLLCIRCRALIQDLVELKKAFEFLVYPEDENFVYWLDFWRRKEVRLIGAPLEVGKILDEKLYDNLKTLILSSATLSIAGDFSFLKKRLGLDRTSSERTFEYALDSPFNLKDNIGFFEAGYLPSPGSNDFDRQASKTIEELFKKTGVRGMVLFTSYKSITTVVGRVGGHLLDCGFELFVQDSNLSPFQLLSRYRQSPKGIIFGTDSFWEGVDLPGDELELLVIARLPFSVPDRPWIKANLEKIEAEGGNPFIEFSLPEAVIKFRQGFGRLIRKKTDRGCIVVLDSRLTAKKYGRFFSDSVRPQLKYCQSLDELIEDAEEYFNR